MNLDINICSVCGKKNFSDSEYDAALEVCMECKERYYTKFTIEELQKDMFETSDEYKKRIDSLIPPPFVKTTF